MAIDAEIRGDFAEACNLFYDSIQEYADESDKAEVLSAEHIVIAKINLEQFAVWEQERMRCFEKLNQWSDVAGSVSVDVKSNFNESLWDPAYRVSCPASLNSSPLFGRRTPISTISCEAL